MSVPFHMQIFKELCLENVTSKNDKIKKILHTIHAHFKYMKHYYLRI